MSITTLAVGLNKQSHNDPAWNIPMDAGFDQANTRLTLAGAGSPEAVTTGHWVGQKYYDTTNKRYFVFNGSPGANTGWIVAGFIASGTAANRTAMIAAPFNGAPYVQNSEATLRLLQMYLGGSWSNVFGYAAGVDAAKPTLDLPADGLMYLNSDKGHPEHRVGGAWVDLWPGIKFTQIRSTFAQGLAEAVANEVEASSGVDLALTVLTPTLGSWKIFVAASCTVRSALGTLPMTLLSKILEGATPVGSPGYATKLDNNSNFTNVTTLPLYLKDAPAAGVSYTYKVQATVDINPGTHTQTDIYALLLRVN